MADIKNIISKLEARNMRGIFTEKKENVWELVKSIIPESATVGYGGSMTVRELGILDLLRENGRDVIARENAVTPEERKQITARIATCDWFIMSTNAITEDGILVNTDGPASRVSFFCYGPENVLVIAGKNKIVKDVPAALERIRTVAAPKNTARLNRNTPCRIDGRCHDCQSPDCICGQTVITRRSCVKNRINVIIVGEELGY